MFFILALAAAQNIISCPGAYEFTINTTEPIAVKKNNITLFNVTSRNVIYTTEISPITAQWTNIIKIKFADKQDFGYYEVGKVTFHYATYTWNTTEIRVQQKTVYCGSSNVPTKWTYIRRDVITHDTTQQNSIPLTEKEKTSILYCQQSKTCLRSTNYTHPNFVPYTFNETRYLTTCRRVSEVWWDYTFSDGDNFRVYKDGRSQIYHYAIGEYTRDSRMFFIIGALKLGLRFENADSGHYEIKDWNDTILASIVYNSLPLTANNFSIQNNLPYWQCGFDANDHTEWTVSKNNQIFDVITNTTKILKRDISNFTAFYCKSLSICAVSKIRLASGIEVNFRPSTDFASAEDIDFISEAAVISATIIIFMMSVITVFH